MADVHDSKTRSYNMSQIQAKDTKPEMLVRKYLHYNGFRYRLHVKDLPGKPDLVLPKYNSIILVHGCFWHAHEDCKYFKIPEARREFWKNKLLRNRERDQQNIKKLKNKEWNVIVVWECELKSTKLEKRLKELTLKLKKNE